MLTLGFSILPCACAAKGSIDAKIAHAMHASLRNSVMGSSSCTTVDPGAFLFEHSLDGSRLIASFPRKRESSVFCTNATGSPLSRGRREFWRPITRVLATLSLISVVVRIGLARHTYGALPALARAAMLTRRSSTVNERSTNRQR